MPATPPVIERLRAAADRNPVTAVVVVGLAVPAIGVLTRPLIAAPLTIRGQIPREAVGAVIVLAIVWLLGWQRRAGLTEPLRRPVNLLALVAMVGVIWGLDAAGLHARGIHDLVAAAALALLVGITEETLARGVVLGGLQTYGPAVAVGVSSLYFGLLHLGNLLLLADPIVIAQAAEALMIGLLLGAVRWRVGSLWPLVLAHALVDLPPLASGVLVPPPSAIAWAALAAVVLLTPWAAIGAGMLAWDEAHWR
jgi:membrane protease YdiL (CAAX protease family)